MPTYLLYITIVFLIGCSALCSGLNMALMALDTGDLRRKSRLGNTQATKVLPLRTNSNLTLVAILLANVAAVSATSLVLGDMFNGLIAGIATTILIVIFGEIIPQVYFVRRALMAMAWFTPLIKILILVTYPLSKPLQLLLDKLFGKHIMRKLQSRHELGLLIAEHKSNEGSDLDQDEIEIIRGALEMSEKSARDIMTPIDNVYFHDSSETVDGAMIDDIKVKNYSRIPIFNPDKTVCYGVLHVKDLIDMDFDHEPTRFIDLTLYPVQVIGGGTALDTLFRKFAAGNTQLMIVQSRGKTVGIVTIEDLIEEIVGREIEDEADKRRAKILQDAKS